MCSSERIHYYNIRWCIGVECFSHAKSFCIAQHSKETHLSYVLGGRTFSNWARDENGWIDEKHETDDYTSGKDKMRTARGLFFFREENWQWQNMSREKIRFLYLLFLLLGDSPWSWSDRKLRKLNIRFLWLPTTEAQNNSPSHQNPLINSNPHWPFCPHLSRSLSFSGVPTQIEVSSLCFPVTKITLGGNTT